MAETLSWGILGTGRIAGTFAKAVSQSKTGRLAAVGSRTRQAAEAFGQQFGIERCHASYEDLLADPEVQVVYISTPHPLHAEWVIKAAEAGKGILCEKPLALNHAEALAVVEAARSHNVFLMEAFMYRCHPQTARLVQLIRESTIGEVRLIQASFSFHTKFDPQSRLLNNALGGGGILDVGCYCVSMARLIAGAAAGKDFDEPIELQGMAHIGSESRVDEWATATLRFRNDILAQLATGVQANGDNTVRIFGTAGHISVPSPWIIKPTGDAIKILVHRNGEDPSEVVIPEEAGLYSIEADTVAAYFEVKQARTPAMSWDDSLGNMKTLDAWRAAIGLTYDAEQPEAQELPVSKRPLSARPSHNMQYGHLVGIDKPISRLVMGTMLEGAHLLVPHAFALFDDFFEHGGNCFDSAYIYAGGKSERILGQWIKSRGVRDEVVIIGKGAHPPHCSVEGLSRQLIESLDRMQLDGVDIYMMHRDNPEIPAGELVDVLNEHLQAGRMRAFGGSNWSIARVEEANAYAESKGLVGLSCISNNFSLARMVEPVWSGCISASDAESRAWFQKTGMPLFAWSSQARGFFVRADPEDQSDPELVRCWYSPDNFQRLDRVQHLAKRHNVSPLNIALAYVLRQRFPTFPLIGPRTLGETRTSLPALDIQLSPQELRWLNLEEDLEA
jgi:predicted dehydrogenase/aryl-alcohol dehydrogenase-like predicted oxidoreductase